MDFLDPSLVLAGLNESFQMDQYEGMYFTIWYGVFDRRSRRLVFANAGHPPGLLVSTREGEVGVDKLGEAGFFIGMMPGVSSDRCEVHVPPRSSLFLFSDGAYEITRPDESMWTLDEFAAVVRATDPMVGLTPLAEVESVIRWGRGVEQSEHDVSILGVRLE